MNDEDINITSIIKKWSKTVPPNKDFILNKLEIIESHCHLV